MVRHWASISDVDIEGPAVLIRRTVTPYDNRAVDSLRDLIYPVSSDGRRYHRRGERPFLTQCELTPPASSSYVIVKRSGTEMIVEFLRRCDVLDKLCVFLTRLDRRCPPWEWRFRDEH